MEQVERCEPWLIKLSARSRKRLGLWVLYNSTVIQDGMPSFYYRFIAAHTQSPLNAYSNKAFSSLNDNGGGSPRFLQTHCACFAFQLCAVWPTRANADKNTTACTINSTHSRYLFCFVSRCVWILIRFASKTKCKARPVYHCYEWISSRTFRVQSYKQ